MAPERPPRQPRRRGAAMPVLFAALTLGFVGIAVAALIARQWVFVAVGVALAAWMSTFVRQALKRRG